MTGLSRFRLRRINPRLPQYAINNLPKVIQFRQATNLFTIHKKRWREIEPEPLSLLH